MKWRLYRLLMKVAHRYDWHYAPEIGPFEDGSTQRWCQWCGFRQSVPPKRSPLTTTNTDSEVTK